jgi:hypothetical protein
MAISELAAGEVQAAEVSGLIPIAKPGATPAAANPLEQAASAELAQGYLADDLLAAEALVSYAAQSGIDVGADTLNTILNARVASHTGMHVGTAAQFLEALTKVASKVAPVTAESLAADGSRSRKVIEFYTVVALALLAVITPFSFITFITTPLSDSISKHVEAGNALAIKLSSELLLPAPGAAPSGTSVPGNATTPAPSVIVSNASGTQALTELQEFATDIRTIDLCATHLNRFAWRWAILDPFRNMRTAPSSATPHDPRTQVDDQFELAVPPNDLPAIAAEKIRAYQSVRYFALRVQGTVSTLFGAITTCILPALYAMLGACAYLLRSYEDQIAKRTFKGDGDGARFLIAGIGGLVVGLFSSFNLAPGSTLPPLGIAFLLGYAVDVFFSFLEGILQTFGKPRGTPAPVSATKS